MSYEREACTVEGEVAARKKRNNVHRLQTLGVSDGQHSHREVELAEKELLAGSHKAKEDYLACCEFRRPPILCTTHVTMT